MSTRKPRRDSVLKTLPEERQEQIMARLKSEGYAETVAWLKADGLRTSVTALSEFYSWWNLRQQLSRNQSTVQTLLSNLHRFDPSYTPGQIQELGQAFFTALALEQQDPKAWAMTQRVGLDREQLQLQRDRFEFDAAKACLEKLPELKQIAADRSLNEDAKLEAVRQRLFGVAPK
jgi:hypothetical protein